jgi:3-hydroxyacyl-CoA dehydrogenase/enoyl-CoA hydratase/3-hydroxybutyryl-CoA epimerase
MSVFQSETVTVGKEPDGSFELRLDVPGRSVNVLTRQMLADLDNALAALEKQPRLPVVVVRSGKKTGFLAGADLAEFVAIRTADEARNVSEAGQKVFSRLEKLSGPTVAVIHGPALGGGLELALACDYRLVYDRPDTQLGLPEVELGLLPAWGGTVRLPRIIGLEPALQVILGGKRLDAKEAKALGLADEVAATEAELRERFGNLLVRAVGVGKVARRGLPLRTWRQWFIESNFLGRWVLFGGAERRLQERIPDDMPGPKEALESVRTGVQDGAEEGFTYERNAAARLSSTPACRNLIGLFFQREGAKKVPTELADATEAKRVAVVGAGVMGAGIAQACALAGLNVVVREVSPAALTAGMERIDALFARAAGRGKVSATQASKARAAIVGTVNWDGFESADVVIEAAVEDLAIKRELFAELARRCHPEAVLATNTSSLTVLSIAEGMPTAERVAGMHFFNPVHKMPLVEVVRHPGTSNEAVGRLVKLAIALGKVPAVVNDGPGFVVNRVLMPYLAEAVQMVAEGVGAAAVDKVMKRFGMMAGPLETLDQIGLDVAAHVARQSGEATLAGAVFAKMVEKGWLGAKSGRGFYEHSSGTETPNAEVAALVRELYKGPTMPESLPLAARLAEARERLVLLTVNEAAKVRDAGIAPADTVDLAMVMGSGWAPHRGGPLRYLATRGPSDVRESLSRLAERLGPRYAPAAGLGG